MLVSTCRSCWALGLHVTGGVGCCWILSFMKPQTYSIRFMSWDHEGHRSVLSWSSRFTRSTDAALWVSALLAVSLILCLKVCALKMSPCRFLSSHISRRRVAGIVGLPRTIKTNETSIRSRSRTARSTSTNNAAMKHTSTGPRFDKQLFNGIERSAHQLSNSSNRMLSFKHPNCAPTLILSFDEPCWKREATAVIVQHSELSSEPEFRVVSRKEILLLGWPLSNVAEYITQWRSKCFWPGRS